mmetsp:Transcript_5545/g.10151  ORF Transcript_5545/g.10151 Transcript_5545/m.10151 type:complete len:284 (-) Transcript_5545:171-1022(-)
MPNNTRGSRPGRPVPDDMEDDRLEEGAARPEIPSRPPIPDCLGQSGRQTSFAREFFNSSTSSGLDVADREIAAALASSDSIHDSVEESDSQSWIEDARRMKQQDSVGGGDWNPAAVNGPSAGGLLDDFGRQEIIEQHRIMAVHEAHVWLKNMTGVDLEEYQKTAPIVGRVNDGFRKALLTPMLPNPRRVTVTNSSMPELKEPELPTLKRRQVQQEYKPEIAPVVHPAVMMSSENEEVPPGEKPLQCLGCKKSLRVQKKALFASCPNCSAKSPAITLHKRGISV